VIETVRSAALDVIAGNGPWAWCIEVCDCRDGLRRMPPNSVHCVVTSPPYWGLRDYQIAPSVWGGDAWLGCLGLEPDPYSYVQHIVEVFAEVWRVLRKDGTLWLNMGDCFANDGKWGGESGGKQSYLDDADRRRNGREHRRTGLKPKCLMGLPWMVAFALRDWGWWLRSDIIWHKPNPLPESVSDRPTKAHEYLFLLSKSKNYFYDAEAIKDDSFGYGSGNKAKRWGNNHTTSRTDAKGLVERQSSIPWKGGQTSKNRRTVWTIPIEPYPGAHFATFPTDLVAPCILAGTSEQGCCPYCGKGRVRKVEVEYLNVGNCQTNGKRSVDRRHIEFGTAGSETRLEKCTRTVGWESGCKCESDAHDAQPAIVLDPFSGAGTTGLVSRILGRRFIGFEASAEYAAQAEARIRHRGAKSSSLRPSAGQSVLF
jgi:DNA modification methylase